MIAFAPLGRPASRAIEPRDVGLALAPLARRLETARRVARLEPRARMRLRTLHQARDRSTRSPRCCFDVAAIRTISSSAERACAYTISTGTPPPVDSPGPALAVEHHDDPPVAEKIAPAHAQPRDERLALLEQ